MKERLLVSLHEVRIPLPIRDDMGGLVAFTSQQPNGEFAAELTRKQWDEMRRTRWASPVLDGSFLIPDVDYQAEDGTIFPTLEACMAHEKLSAPTTTLPDTAGHAVLESRILNAVASASVHVTDLAKALGCDNEAIKAVVKESKFLRWTGPRIALAETSIPA